MTAKPLACVILAAGKGTRMKSRLPKVMHPLAGMPLLGHLLQALGQLNPVRIVVVVSDGAEQVAAYVAPHQTVVQMQQLGTGHAARTAFAALQDFHGDVLIVNGDMPLITGKRIKALVAARQETANTGLAILGMRPKDPTPYGRFVMGSNGLERIVEALDATEEERKIGLVNAGPIVGDRALLFDLLNRIDDDNAKGEYYLTDVVKIARAGNHICAVVEAPEEEALGINSRAELAAAEALMQKHLRAMAMEEGATLVDPATVYFSADTMLGRDVRIEPNVFFGPGVTVEDEALIRSFSHLEKTIIRKGATIGPFARLRPGSDIGPNAVVGNFVEIKNTVMGEKSQAKHLTYLGDTELGAGSNVGAGTITCNYDGFKKYRTTIGKSVFVGANTTFVSPITIGEGAITGAGSVITKDVPADALAVSRSPQRVVEDGAKVFREKRKK